MPIIFEAPGPFSPATSIGAGQAEQYSKDLPSLIAQQRTLAGLYEAMARARAGGGGGGGQDTRPQSGPANAGGGYGQGVLLAPPPRDDPLTQSENLRLQRLQNARSLIQQQVSDGTLSTEDANNLLIQAQTGIDPLKGQQERAQAKLRNQQMEALQQQQEMAVRQEQDATAFRGRSMQDRTSHVTGPNGEYLGTYVQHDANGRGTFVPHNPATREQGLPAALINTIQHQVDQRVDAQIRHFSNPLNSTGAPAWMATEEGQARHREEEHQRAVARARTQVSREQASAQQASDPRVTGGMTPGATPANAPAGSVGGISQAGRPGEPPPPPHVQQQMQSAQAALNRLFERPGSNPDAGMVRGEPEPSNTGGMGAAGNIPVMAQYLNSQPRPERPNEASDVDAAAVSRAAQRATELYNATPGLHRRLGGETRRLGVMADILLNAHNRTRGLTRHELAAYRRIQDQIGSFEGADDLRL